MGQNKIIIYGDSFADPNHRKIDHPEITAWYDLLKSDYKVINKGLAGTGPHYSFKEYYRFIAEEEDLEDYIIIFVLSEENRIAFPNANPCDISNINWDFDKKESNNVDEHQKSVKIYYETFKSEIDFFFLTQQDDLMWSNFKNLGFLYMNSLLLNMKTIVFHTDDIKVLSRMDFLNFKKLNNLNFYFHPIALGYYSYNEFIDVETIAEEVLSERKPVTVVDERRNHFSQENHTVLYENIKKAIKGEYDDFIPFINDVDYSYNLGKMFNTNQRPTYPGSDFVCLLLSHTFLPPY